MSLELLLIPAGLAAVAAVRAARQSNTHQVQVGTRMKNEKLLQAALADIGANATMSGNDIIALWPQWQAVFSRDDQGIWSASFTGDIAQEQAGQLVHQLDTP